MLDLPNRLSFLPQQGLVDGGGGQSGVPGATRAPGGGGAARAAVAGPFHDAGGGAGELTRPAAWCMMRMIALPSIGEGLALQAAASRRRCDMIAHMPATF